MTDRPELSLSWQATVVLSAIAGTFFIGAGVLTEWAVEGSSRVPWIWLLIESLSGEHGFRAWTTFLGLLIYSVGANEIAKHGRSRWLRRVPSLLVAAGFGALGWYSYEASRYLLVAASGLMMLATMMDPQPTLPEARVVERS